MPIDLSTFESGRKLKPGERAPRISRPKEPKMTGPKDDLPTQEYIDNVEWKYKCQGKCWSCMFWEMYHGDNIAAVRECRKRLIKMAGYLGCRGYYRSKW